MNLYISPTKHKEITALLNHTATILNGDQASFYIHYWGANPSHLTNHIHKHSFFEICFVVNGSGSYIEEGVAFALDKGAMFCSRPDRMHQIISEPDMFLLWVAFEAIEGKTTSSINEIIHEICGSSPIFIENAETTTACAIWKTLWKQAEHHSSMAQFILPALANSLLLSLLQLFRQPDMNVTGKLPLKTASVLLPQIKMFIRDNMSQPLQLDDVANNLHISGRHLSRLLVMNTGQSYTAFVRSERVNKAAYLLANTDMAIEQVAEECGFASIHYFSKVFSTEQGMPPGQYRKRMTTYDQV